MKMLLLLILIPWAPAAEPDIVPDILAFEKHWTPFLYKLAGCEQTRTFEKPVCRDEKREMDTALFLKARKAAAKLFSLKDEG